MTIDSRIKLSNAARSLWGKSDFGMRQAWLPLFVHVIDSSLVAQRLWDEWLPLSTKRMLSRALSRDEQLIRALFVFLGATHDIGKATPAFQIQPCSWSMDGDAGSLAWIPEHAGLVFAVGSREKNSPKHATAGQAILERLIRSKTVAPVRGIRGIASIVGCHHGKSPSSFDVRSAKEEHPTSMGFDNDTWQSVQEELFGFCLDLAGIALEDLGQLARDGIAPQAASVLSGLLIMCDWIASNTYAFPLVLLDAYGIEPFEGGCSYDGSYEDRALLNSGDEGIPLELFRDRAQKGWDRVNILPSWSETLSAVDSCESLYKARFAFPEGALPRPVQKEALSIASAVDEPGLMIIEAPMGEGKTEAALAAAEVFAAKTGAGGVCVALPTMATTDAMFSRVHSWLERLLPASGARSGTVYLAHGKAQLNEEYQGIISESRYRMGDMDHDGEKDSFAEVSDWMFGSKKGMLSSFVVCTVDQVLMGALQMKHLALRQLSLANKVVVIDECHAYDMYMRQYLDVVLSWLGSWHVPVILLSATLPKAQRQEMATSYLEGWLAGNVPQAIRDLGEVGSYPRITYTNGPCISQASVLASGRAETVRTEIIADDDEALVELLRNRLCQGGCAGVVCDTVSRAQNTAQVLAKEFGKRNVTLAHARFADIDRMDNERRLRNMLGPNATLENGKRPQLHIVVGTQVLEQSLDIDFDLLVTDLAPIDLLFQRMGRCHRHARPYRPEGVFQARCFIRGISEWNGGVPVFSGGVTNVYEKANLLETLGVCVLLKEGDSVDLLLPQDISKLVQLAYGQEAATVIPSEWDAAYKEACEHRERNSEEKRQRAKCCLLRTSQKMAADRMTLTDWYSLSTSNKRDKDYGPRAVRDTQETVEVVLLRLADNSLCLLPWVGETETGIEAGAEIPTDEVPDPRLAKLAVQSTVRLPLSLCRPEEIESLVSALEEMDEPFVGMWQESPWLQGQLVLPLRGDGDLLSAEITLSGEKKWLISYAREIGLTAQLLKY